MRRLRESAEAFSDVFRNSNLRKLELAGAGSVIGAWAYSVAIAVYAYDHGGATAVGVVAAIRWIAAGSVSPLAAVLGDRYERRLVMISSDLVRAAMIGAAAVAVAAGAPAIVVYAISVLIIVSATPFRPAEAALMPSLARTPEELTAANVVASTIESLGIFGGPALGGVLLTASGTVTVFIVTAGCHVWSALLVSRVRPPHEAEASHAASDEEPAKVALLGGIVGALVTAALVARRRLAGDFGIGMFLWGVPLILVALWPKLAVGLLLLGIVGIGNTMVDVFGTTLLQRSAPEAVVARVFGLLEAIGLLAVALGALVTPGILSLIGARWTLVVAGGLLPLLMLPSWRTLAAIDRDAAIPSDRVSLLRGVPIFALLPEPTIEHLASELVPDEVPAGTTIFRRGDEGDRFYVIDDGTVEVRVDSSMPIELGRGDFFGEIALLRDVPRTATVTARTDTRLYSLNWDAFVPAVTGHGPSRRAADTVIGARLGGGRAGLVPA